MRRLFLSLDQLAKNTVSVRDHIARRSRFFRFHGWSLLLTRKQIRAAEAGVSRFHLLGPHSSEFHQLLMQACVESRSVPAGDSLQRADDELRQRTVTARSASNGGRTFAASLPSASCTSARVHRRKSDARKLPPAETPLAARSVLLAPVILGFPLQRGRGIPRSRAPSARRYDSAGWRKRV